ncbi:MAG TPA: hypothetical protein VN580_01160, partial [Clostridia bacterium]|nr:hypothetical protein [Clostridia bacterium]
MATVSNRGITSKQGRLKHTMNIFINSSFRLYLILGVLGLLLGRAVILDFLNPFCIAFLAAAMLQELNLFVVGISILLGVFSIGEKGILLKYLFAALPMILIYAAAHKTGFSRKLIISATAALANLAAGYFVFYIRNYYLYDLLMIIIESILIAILVYIYDCSIPIIKSYKSRRLLSAEEVVAITVLAAFC